MKTTVRLDDELYARVKQLAASTGRSVSDIIEESLRMTLAIRRAAAGAPLRLITVRGNGLLPGVDLESSGALLDLMQESSRGQ